MRTIEQLAKIDFNTAEKRLATYKKGISRKDGESRWRLASASR